MIERFRNITPSKYWSKKRIRKLNIFYKKKMRKFDEIFSELCFNEEIFMPFH